MIRLTLAAERQNARMRRHRDEVADKQWQYYVSILQGENARVMRLYVDERNKSLVTLYFSSGMGEATCFRFDLDPLSIQLTVDNHKLVDKRDLKYLANELQERVEELVRESGSCAYNKALANLTS